MQLDFIDNINQFGEAFVRLYDFNREEATLFKKALDYVVLEEEQPLHLSKLNFIKSRNCTLALHITEEDLGIQTLDKKAFFCCMTPGGYREMSEALEPFTQKETLGFKVLYDVDTEIDFLFAPAGTWEDEDEEDLLDED